MTPARVDSSRDFRRLLVPRGYMIRWHTQPLQTSKQQDSQDQRKRLRLIAITDLPQAALRRAKAPLLRPAHVLGRGDLQACTKQCNMVAGMPSLHDAGTDRKQRNWEEHAVSKGVRRRSDTWINLHWGTFSRSGCLPAPRRWTQRAGLCPCSCQPFVSLSKQECALVARLGTGTIS